MSELLVLIILCLSSVVAYYLYLDYNKEMAIETAIQIPNLAWSDPPIPGYDIKKYTFNIGPHSLTPYCLDLSEFLTNEYHALKISGNQANIKWTNSGCWY
jgi:hypothetical protein